MQDQAIRTRNDKYQIFESYKTTRAKRSKSGKIFIEGVIPVNLALENGIDVAAILVNEERPLSDWAHDVIGRAQPDALYRLSAELHTALSGKSNGSELIVIANQPTTTLADVDFGRYSRLLILDRPSSHGNLGTILRCCDAFKVDCVLITGRAVDHYDPKTITASRGTVFTQPILTVPANDDVLALVQTLKTTFAFRFYGTSAQGDADLRTVAFAEKSCLLIGNETVGLSRFYRDLADEMLKIDMAGAATSLNIACATAILLYQLDGAA